MAFFVDTYFTKINPLMFKMAGLDHGDPQEKIADEILRLLGTEIEPLLADVGIKDAGPYFGGSHQITFVEVSA
jgi:glutathione S-transferase